MPRNFKANPYIRRRSKWAICAYFRIGKPNQDRAQNLTIGSASMFSWQISFINAIQICQFRFHGILKPIHISESGQNVRYVRLSDLGHRTKIERGFVFSWQIFSINTIRICQFRWHGILKAIHISEGGQNVRYVHRSKLGQG